MTTKMTSGSTRTQQGDDDNDGGGGGGRHYLQLAQDLSDQPWHEIGNCPDPICATDDSTMMIDQLTALLSARLVDVVAAREEDASTEEFLVPLVQQQQQQPEEEVAEEEGGVKHPLADSSAGNDDRGSRSSGGDGQDDATNATAPPTTTPSHPNNAQSNKTRFRSLSPALQRNLRSYVKAMADEYKAVPFHSLEHAVHVTVSVNKVLSMTLRPDDVSPSGVVVTGGGNCNGGSGYDSGSDAGGDHCGSHYSSGTGTNNPNNQQQQQHRRSTIQHVVPGCGVAVVRDPQPSNLDVGLDDYENHATAAALSEATFGLASDPLIKFALVFACLIHDVGHEGVPNATLIDEEDELAILHNDVSVAEQNSLSIAFQHLLSRDEFGLLKRAVMPDKEARKAFRKLVIDIVLATDISSPERMQVTKSRWKEAFESSVATARPEVIEVGDQPSAGVDADDASHTLEGCINRRFSNDSMRSARNSIRRHTMYSGNKSMRCLQAARIGMRHSLQLGGKLIDVYNDDADGSRMLRQHAMIDAIVNVADVAHTMQAFPVFIKWNRRLYEELLVAYHRGRIGWDPTVGWAENQIQFFDAYIIPLAEKLDMCGIFGSKSSVFLYFAMENKRRWGMEGDRITEEMVDEIGRKMLVGMVEEAKNAAAAADDDDADAAGGDGANSNGVDDSGGGLDDDAVR